MSRIIPVVVLILLGPGFAIALWHQLIALLDSYELLLILLGGAMLGVLFDHFVARRRPAVGTFEHELTHAIAALIFLRRVTRFVVIRGEGGLTFPRFSGHRG